MDEQKMLDFISAAWENGLREQMNIPADWKYFSNRTTKEAFDIFISIIGTENVKFVSGTLYNTEDGVQAFRFSCFTSPQATKNAEKCR